MVAKRETPKSIRPRATRTVQPDKPKAKDTQSKAPKVKQSGGIQAPLAELQAEALQELIQECNRNPEKIIKILCSSKREVAPRSCFNKEQQDCF